MSFRLGNNASNSVRVASTNAIVACPNTGTTNTTGRILIYSGSQPATPETTATGGLLVTINFANPAYGTANTSALADLAGGTAITATVTATGTAGWFRVTDRNNNQCWDGSVGLSGSGADLIFDDTSFVTTGTVTISSLSISSPM